MKVQETFSQLKLVPNLFVFKIQGVKVLGKKLIFSNNFVNNQFFVVNFWNYYFRRSMFKITIHSTTFLVQWRRYGGIKIFSVKTYATAFFLQFYQLLDNLGLLLKKRFVFFVSTFQFSKFINNFIK